MDLNFYSDLSRSCSQNVDSEFIDTQAYGGYCEDNKFSTGSNGYLCISGAGHPFLSSEQTFHTPNLGDEVFEIPPITLDPDQALSISDVSHFELTDEPDSTTLVAANDPSFASSFVNSGARGLDQVNLGTMALVAGGALLSSSALEMGNPSGSHFSSSSMTIDVQLGDMGHGLMSSSQLATINQSELAVGLCAAPGQPLSATPSPASSLLDEDMDDFKRSVLGDSSMSLTSALSHSTLPFTHSLSAPSRSGDKPINFASLAETAAAKKGKRKKDPNEPQKPVSAYALFFRDTQAAIKGQNPNASFGEVSKIVASMWDSLADDQRQVYKRKTEAAKKEYLKALAAYKANQLTQPALEEMDTNSSPPESLTSDLITQEASCSANTIVGANTITTTEMITCSQTGAKIFSPEAGTSQTITKIIIPKHLLQRGGQVVTVVPGGAHTPQPALVVSSGSRQPPPLQQMQGAPPLPRLQQMAQAPPPLQAKPKEGGATPGHTQPVSATPPPPLQIKILPVSISDSKTTSIIVPVDATTSSVDVVNDAATSDPDLVTEGLHSDDDVMEVGGSSVPNSICVRSGCNNPAVDSKDWDREYCSNECVATHCKNVFKAWCQIRNQNLGKVN